jgi:Cas6b C-terminal domain/Cas6b N-terminal domain
MSHSLKYLRVEFDEQISAYEVPQFRGALIAKVGRENVLFHNHLDDKQYQYGYPLIQYKTVFQRPTLVCLQKGIDEMHHFFSQPEWTLQLHDKALQMKIAKLDMQEYTMNVWDKWFHYHIHNWLALDETSYHAYKQHDDEVSRIRTLESKLCGNIISFAKGIQWQLPEKDIRPLECRITSPIIPQILKVKGVSLMGFSLDFKTNAFLPPHIGLGKSSSRGYGVVRSL